PASSKASFCKAVSKISSRVANSSSSSACEQATAAKSLAKSIRKAAKSAPATVKDAMGKMASYFDTIANAGGNPARIAAAIAKVAKDYSKAALTFSKYYNKNCLSISTTTTT